MVEKIEYIHQAEIQKEFFKMKKYQVHLQIRSLCN